jgi:hypothetical protein
MPKLSSSVRGVAALAILTGCQGHAGEQTVKVHFLNGRVSSLWVLGF